MKNSSIVSVGFFQTKLGMSWSSCYLLYLNFGLPKKQLIYIFGIEFLKNQKPFKMQHKSQQAIHSSPQEILTSTTAQRQHKSSKKQKKSVQRSISNKTELQNAQNRLCLNKRKASE